MSDSTLQYFVDGWMHQDLDLDYDDIAGAAADFGAYPMHDVEALLGELREVLQRCSEPQLHRAFDAMLAQYQPTRPGELRRQLVAAVAVLEQAVAQRVLLRAGLAAVLRSWYVNQGDAPVSAGLLPEEQRALAEGLPHVVAMRGDDANLVKWLRDFTGEAVAARPDQARQRLQAVLDELTAPA